MNLLWYVSAKQELKEIATERNVVMDKIKLGLVGVGVYKGSYGRGGGLFTMAGKNFEQVKLTAACDINPVSLGYIKKNCPEVEAFTDYREMLDKAALDAVIIGTPAIKHAEFSIAALQRDISVLSEIPVVYKDEEVGPLLEAERDSEAIFMTAANPNFAGRLHDLQRVKELGLLGEPNYMEVDYMHDLRYNFQDAPWRAEYEPIHYCTHSLGPLLTLFEEDLEYVTCFDTGGWLESGKPNRHDIMTALFRTKSNRVVKLTVSFINNFKRKDAHRCIVHGTKGVYGWEDPDKTFFNTTELPGAHIPVELHSSRFDIRYPQSASAGHGGMDYVVMDAFLKAVATGRPSPLSLREGLRMSLPGIYAAKSARCGGELTKIKYPW